MWKRSTRLSGVVGRLVHSYFHVEARFAILNGVPVTTVKDKGNIRTRVVNAVRQQRERTDRPITETCWSSAASTRSTVGCAVLILENASMAAAEIAAQFSTKPSRELTILRRYRRTVQEHRVWEGADKLHPTYTPDRVVPTTYLNLRVYEAKGGPLGTGVSTRKHFSATLFMFGTKSQCL